MLQAAPFPQYQGGGDNTASGRGSTVSGGTDNIAAGDYSWAGGCNMQLTEDADRTFAWGYSDSNVSISTPDSFIIYSGNVGIGTMNPTEKLEVAGTVKATAFVGDGSYLTGISSESFARSTSKTVTASYSPEFGDPGLITDGVFAPEGTGWSDANYAVGLNSAGYDTNLKIDLGAIYDIYRLRVQADDNDDYRVEYSMDGSTWNTLYDLPRAAHGGLKTRDSGTFESVKARYLRIYVVSGDDAYSVSEVEVYAYGINIAESGNVGIGTTNPEKPLEVTGSDERGVVKLSFSSNDRYLSLGGDWPYIDSYGPGARLLLNFNSDQDIDIGNGDLYIVNSSGNVGIGTTNPHTKLHVEGTIEVDQKIQANDSGGLELAADDGITRLHITDNGNIGIGTSSPGAILHIHNDNAAIPTFRIGNTLHGGLEFTQGSGDLFLGGANSQAGNFYVKDVQGNIRIAINSDTSSYFNSGNVGIGTTGPGYKLHVIGDIAYTGSIYDVSDIRLKENISFIENAIEKVSSINGIYFNNKGESPEKREVGVIAQEVEGVLPEVVSEDNEGYKSVDYSKLTPLLIEAIKELKSENEELKERILALEEALHP